MLHALATSKTAAGQSLFIGLMTISRAPVSSGKRLRIPEIIFCLDEDNA